MGRSTCAKCANSTFEIKHAQSKHYSVHCSFCGSPIGVIEFRNAARLIDELGKEVLDNLVYVGDQLKRTLTGLDRLKEH
jgi:hypothetical protein